jgi:hypothetical protein
MAPLKKRGYLPQVEASRVVRGVDDGPKTDRFDGCVLVLQGQVKKTGASWEYKK